MAWMYLGQLLAEKHSLECFERGVGLMKEKLASAATTDEEKPILIQRIVSGLVSGAELYLTDLCFEENAESMCESLLQEALSYDSNAIEPLQSLASMRISQVQSLVTSPLSSDPCRTDSFFTFILIWV